jgi:hypothetical protein
MKKFAFLIACLFITLRLVAQDCTQFYYMQKNKIIEMSSFDDKGAFTSKSISKVSDVNTVNGVTTATVVSEVFDKNGKSKGRKSTMNYKCDGGALTISMNFDDSKKGNSASKKNNINFTYAEYPTGMKVGDHLKDYTSQFTENIGSTAIVATSQIHDRVVVAKENVTTTAGSWNCLKITYKTTVTISGPYKVPPQTEETTEWIVPGFGIVKVAIKSLGIMSEITGLK